MITFLSNLLLFFLSIVNTLILSRVLGPAGKGVVDVANNFLSFAIIILGMGFASSNIFFLGKKKENAHGIFGNNILIAILGIVVLVPFYFIQNHWHFKFLQGITNLQMLAILVTVPLITFKSAMINVLLGLQDIVEYNRINIVDKVLSLVLLAGFLLIAVSPTAAILSILVGTVLICVWQVYIFVIGRRITPKLDSALLKAMLGYGLKAQTGNIIQRLNYRLDVFIVNYFLPIGQVGIYGIAVVLGETLWGVTGSMATIIFPIASSATDKKEMSTFTNQITRVSFAIIIIFSILIGLFGKIFIILFFGPAFVAASGALLWLLPGISIFSVSNILASYLAGAGLLEKNIYASIVSGIVTVILDIYLIPRIGINGASIATSLSYTVCTLMTIWFYIQDTQARWQDILILKGSDIAQIRAFIVNKINKQ
ncbi:MAG: polysaccharide biosynthesis C-terminal domain-containing protein [Desulfosporosinus sp.]|nr:polysaccharide biosynthesis C-terminal domain-containing protein [Desulfosporosinus sp.]